MNRVVVLGQHISWIKSRSAVFGGCPSKGEYSGWVCFPTCDQVGQDFLKSVAYQVFVIVYFWIHYRGWMSRSE